MEASASQAQSAEHRPSRADRELLRERERRSRERRAEKLRRQRAIVSQYESVVAVLPKLLDADDASKERVLHPDAVRVRDNLQRSMALTRDQQQLELERSQLSVRLHEHRMTSLAIQSLLSAASNDNWAANIQRWRAITRECFTPWTMEACLEEIEAAQKEFNAFVWSRDTQLLGASFFGWRLRRRIVESRDALQFSYEKKILGSPMANLVDVWWNCYRHPTMYNEIVVGSRGRGWVDVLQELSDDLMIVRIVDSTLSTPLVAHTIYLGCRVKTETGYLLFLRKVVAPEVQKKTNQLSDMWASNFVWLSFYALNGDWTDYRVHIGGMMAGNDPSYAAHWLMETLGVVLRTEWAATKRGLLGN